MKTEGLNENKSNKKIKRDIFAEIKAGKYHKEKPEEIPLNIILKEDNFAKEEENKRDVEYKNLKEMTDEEFIQQQQAQQKVQLKNNRIVETVGGQKDNRSYMDKVKEFIDKKFDKKFDKK